MSRPTLIRLLLLAAILLTFGRILTHDFVDWDDGIIFRNPNVVHPTLASMDNSWNPFDSNNISMYDPMVYTLWWGLARAARLENPDELGATLNPNVYHAANLAVHWLCACVVFEILRRLKFRDWPALAGAMLFALHPIQTEAVAWATGMKDLLSGLFALLAIWRYLAAAQLSEEPSRQKTNYLVAFACLIGALLCKPSTVVLPVLVAVIDRLLLRRSWREVVRSSAPWMVPVAAIAVIALCIQPNRHVDGGPLWARPLIALDALAFYLYKIAIPIRLSFDYGRNPTAVLSDPSLHHPLYWTWIFPIVLAVIVWRTRRPALWAAGLMFLVPLLPVLGFITFVFQYYSTVADRYVYVSMFGVALAAAWVIQNFSSRILTAAVCMVLVVLSALSFVQAGVWKDTPTLYEHGLSLNRTQGLHYLSFGNYEDGLAQICLRQVAAAQRRGDFASAEQSLQQYEHLLAQAVQYYQTAIEFSPTNPSGYDHLATDYVRLNRIDDAIAIVRQWMQIEPQVRPDARQRPETLPAMLGSLYLRAHRYPQAIEMLKESLRFRADADVQKNLQLAQKLAGSATRTTQP